MGGKLRRAGPLGKPRPEVTTEENEHGTNSGANDPGDGIEGVARAARGQGLGCFGGDSDGGHDEEADARTARATDGKGDDGGRAEADKKMK